MRHGLILAGAMLAIAAPARADDWDFILINDSGKEIKLVELAPTGTETWQKNRIEEDVKSGPIKPGGRTTVHFDKSGSQCKYDVKATFADDTTDSWKSINVCDNAYVTLRYKNGAPVFAAN